MKLRLLPRREDAYLDLFEAAADNIVTAANTLLDMLSNLGEAEALAKHLVDLEHEGDRITRDILTRLATTFIARFDRDEIYTLADGLDDVTDAIEEVGDVIVLHGISQPLRGVQEQALVLVRAAEHTAEGMRGLRQPSPERLAVYVMALRCWGAMGIGCIAVWWLSCTSSTVSTLPSMCFGGRTSPTGWRRRSTSWRGWPTPSTASRSGMCS
jgi:hypothetical protein